MQARVVASLCASCNGAYMMLRPASLSARLRAALLHSSPARPGITPGPTARSLAEAYSLRDTATALSLAGHADVRCVNIMCGKAGLGCACRVAQPIERMASTLTALDLSHNALPDLPDSIAHCAQLVELRLQHNRLAALDVLVHASQQQCYRQPIFAQLEVLDLSHNAFTRLLLPPPPSSADDFHGTGALVTAVEAHYHGKEGLPLAVLEALPRLRCLNIAGNPLLADVESVTRLRSCKLYRTGVLRLKEDD